jgi:uncharacterized membrane protein
MILHQPGFYPLPGIGVPRFGMFVLYPLIPWIAVMAAGYALAPVFLQPEGRRRRTLLGIGLVVTAGFVVLRATNLYGDPAPWAPQDGLLPTLLSFVNCEKYPPSLLYLAMTLGPGLILLGSFEPARTGPARAVVTIGRVPLLFYVAHIVLVHAMAFAVAALTTGDVAWLLRRLPPLEKPPAYGLPLPAVYWLWVAALFLLYPLCRWFAAVKQRRRDRWLSYV